MTKARKFCVTINNFQVEDIGRWDALVHDAAYSVRGTEVGDSGTPHLQCYVRFVNPRSFDSIKKALPRAHIETAKGNDDQNRKYCTKDDPDAKETGSPNVGQGRRTDIDEVRAVLRQTSSMSEVMKVATSYQSAKMGELILKYDETPRPYRPRRVIWRYGATGTGKTYGVYQEHPDVYCPISFKWWDGYDGHKTVLLDDIRGDYCKFHEILMLTGERPFRVESKGGSRQAMYDTIYITSPFHPQDLWQTVEDKSQLLDRITEIQHFGGPSKRNRSGGTEVKGNTNLNFCADDL